MLRPNAVIADRTSSDKMTDRDISDLDKIWNGQSFLEKIEKVRGDNVFYQYDQSEPRRASHACTIYQGMTAISWRFNYQFTEDELYEAFRLWEQKYWYMPGVWNFTKNWANVSVKYRNSKFPDKKMMYFTMDLDSDNTYKALQKNIMVWFTYRGNRAYSRDVKDDHIIQGTWFGEPTFWHTHVMAWLEKIDWVEHVKMVDNYASRAYNIHHIPYKNISKLIRERTYYKNCYIYLPTAHVIEYTWLSEDATKLALAKMRVNSIIWDRAENHINSTNNHVDVETLRKMQDFAHQENNFLRTKT